KPADHRSDIFALGILLYEMATGRRPFQGPTAAEVMASILRDTPASVLQLRPELPRQLDRILRHCLARDPDARFQSALDLRNELADLQRELESGDVEAPAPAHRSRKGWSGVALAGAGLIAAAAIGIGWWATRDADP